jgi:cysteine-S-conjugate beta-lyase
VIFVKYDFDAYVNRIGTASVKWDELETRFGSRDLISMWVADMDFLCPKPVIDALTERTLHGVYGYTARNNFYLESICRWMKTRHHWHVEKEWICHSPGVVPAIGFIVNAFTQPGDKIIVQPPVYHPFSKIAESSGRQVVYNPLLFDGKSYTMDFDDLRKKARAGAKMILLCSPHNPVGRVWTKDELMTLGQICTEYNILVVSDEIHFDLVYKDYTHTPFASISDEFAMNAIICTAPSKTFNLAGLQTSNIIIPNEKLRQQYTNFVERFGLTLGNTFGLVALEAAYNHGAEWLDQLIDYLKANLDFMTGFISEKIPNIHVIEPEGTYLVWLDFRELNMNDSKLEQFMRTKGGVALDDGYIFGHGGSGFERINIACPRSVLANGLTRIERALNQLN